MLPRNDSLCDTVTPAVRYLSSLLYIATGLVCIFVDVLLVGAMLGMTTPTYSVGSLFIAPLFGIGPALLIFAGLTTLIENFDRRLVSTVTGILIVGGLALWTVPRTGWRDATWVVLEPAAGSFLLAGLLLVLLKKRWIVAAVGGAASGWFFVYGTASLVFHLLLATAILSRTEIWIVLPAILTVASFVFALVVRTA